MEKLDEAFSKNDMASAGRLLEYWLGEAVSAGDTPAELTLTNELVGLYRKAGEGEKALAAARRALSLTASLGQSELVSGATIMLNCATAYKAFDKAEEALPLYRRAEQIYLAALEPGDVRLAGLYNNMALTLVDLGKTEAAEQAYIKAIEIMEEAPAGSADAAISYVNMAHMYEEAHTQESELKIYKCLSRARAHLSSDSLPHDGYYAYVCEKCAPSFEYFGFCDYAKELSLISKEIYERH